ncbi:hypothetical protein HDU97_004946 [Phlyctochytrium planicorne]|nr:hypothetical protein HDU97_004946 [Phlyctochytrium planicorne]
MVLGSLPLELQVTILKWLPPTCGKLIASALGLQAAIQNVPFAAASLRQIGFRGDRLRLLDWLRLGKYYVAALLSSVAVGNGLLHILCRHHEDSDDLDPETTAIVANPPCSDHKALILDAIQLLMPSNSASGADPPSSRVWATCRHPLSLPFLTMLGLKSIVADVISGLPEGNIIVNQIILELAKHLVVARQLPILSTLQEHPRTAPIYNDMPTVLRACCYAICGDVEQLSKLCHDNAQLVDQFMPAYCDYIYALKPGKHDMVEDMARGLRYILSRPGRSFNIETLANYLHSNAIVDLVFEFKLFDNTINTKFLIDYVPSSAIRRVDDVERSRDQFRLWLLVPSNAETVGSMIARAAELGMKDVLNAWIELSVIQSHPSYKEWLNGALNWACRLKRLDIATDLILNYKAGPDNSTLIAFAVTVIGTELLVNVAKGFVHISDYKKDAGMADFLKLLLSHSPPSGDYKSALTQFCLWDRGDLVKILSEHKKTRLPETRCEELVKFYSADVYRLCTQDKRFDFLKLNMTRKLLSAAHVDLLDEIKAIFDIPQKFHILMACKYNDFEYVQRNLAGEVIPAVTELLAEDLMLAVSLDREEIVDAILDYNLKHQKINAKHLSEDLISLLAKTVAVDH